MAGLLVLLGQFDVALWPPISISWEELMQDLAHDADPVVSAMAKCFAQYVDPPEEPQACARSGYALSFAFQTTPRVR